MKGLIYQKYRKALLVGIALMFVLTGCGRRQQVFESSSKEEESREEENSEEEEESKFVYLEQREINDFNDGGHTYTTYMPKGCEVYGRYGSYTDHGLSYTARVDNYGDGDKQEQYDTFADGFEVSVEDKHKPEDDYTDVNTTGILSNGEDRYYILTARGIDFEGVPFEMRYLEYIEMQSTGACINWNLYVYADHADEDTNLIIGEMEECFGIDLEQMKAGSKFTEGEPDPDYYEVKEGHNALEDAEGYQYLGVGDMSDYYKKSFCRIMLPKARSTNLRTDHAYAYLHGVQITLDVNNFFYGNTLMDNMKKITDASYESRESDENVIRNLEKTNIVSVPGFKDAVLMEISYEKKGSRSNQYFSKAEIFEYIRMDSENYLSVEIYLSGEDYDDSTNVVIKELENAYGIDLSNYYNKESSEEIADGIESSVTVAAMMENEADESREEFPDTVLWFNATYALLTYSNGWDWRLVGGVEPTEKIIESKKYVLQSSWHVSDRQTALATAMNLRENGHRGSFQKCMDELDELGLLDLEEKDFKKEFLKSEIKDKDYRYILAYNMHQAGYDADDMAAWDLCRVNELYADFYICGYMTYEEAMDASLENSLILQQMYSSWEEMMEGYMLGFQFWSRDSGKSEDSAMKERYHFYELLRESQDSPYMLDWDMELEKNW